MKKKVILGLSVLTAFAAAAGALTVRVDPTGGAPRPLAFSAIQKRNVR